MSELPPIFEVYGQKLSLDEMGGDIGCALIAVREHEEVACEMARRYGILGRPGFARTAWVMRLNRDGEPAEWDRELVYQITVASGRTGNTAA